MASNRSTLEECEFDIIGGFNYEFVDGPLPDDFNCPICKFVQREPYQATCCGKIYCISCLDKLKRCGSSHFKCPNCRNSLEKSYFKDTNMGRKIRHLEVYCINKERECTWTGQLQSVTEHISTCPKEIVDCPKKCGQQVQRESLGGHLQEVCPRRRYRCPHCHRRGEYAHMMGDHLDKCPELLLPCPNNECDVVVKRGEVEAHRLECPKECVTCPYASLECNTKMPRDKLNHHVKHNVHKHLDQAIAKIADLTIRLERAEKVVGHLVATQPVLECRSSPSVIIKMDNFAHCLENKEIWHSSGFYTAPGQYKICLQVYPHGFDKDEGTYLTPAICLMSGQYDATLEWPFKGEVTIELLNQLEDAEHKKCIIYFDEFSPKASRSRVVQKQYGLGWATCRFVRLSKLDSYDCIKNCHYLVNDTLYFRVTASINLYNKPWFSDNVIL